jgi:hypothetical protein
MYQSIPYFIWYQFFFWLISTTLFLSLCYSSSSLLFSLVIMSDVPPLITPVPSSQNPPINDHSTNTPNIDPLAIHHSDNPATVLVTPLLTVDNYGSWSRAVTMALRAKNKFGFVDGTLASPKNKDDIPKWQRCNDMVASWILNSVSTEIRPSTLKQRHKSGPI